jgi:hypothetical protein
LQDVIPDLRARIKPGGVYLGVGPEQNFTYIQALEPKMAFVLDIRRHNALEHLLYKALFELSTTRVEFLSLLFSRAVPKGLNVASSPAVLFDAYTRASPDEMLFDKNLARILNHLVSGHSFSLSAEDEDNLRYVYSAFFDDGPEISYTFRDSSYQGTSLRVMPTYRQLMEETDGKGRNWSFLASEDHFQKVQGLQKRNLIIPIVGNFAGPKAIRAVGEYLRRHNATVSVFYTSNVEMYLFQNEAHVWQNFYANVAALPLDTSSSFIRFAVDRGAFTFLGGLGRSQKWSPVQRVLEGVESGAIRSYPELLKASR